MSSLKFPFGCRRWFTKSVQYILTSLKSEITNTLDTCITNYGVSKLGIEPNTLCNCLQFVKLWIPSSQKGRKVNRFTNTSVQKYLYDTARPTSRAPVGKRTPSHNNCRSTQSCKWLRPLRSSWDLKLMKILKALLPFAVVVTLSQYTFLGGLFTRNSAAIKFQM